MAMLIVLASDHNGYAAKSVLVSALAAMPDVRTIDIGPFRKGERVDYVDYARQVAQIVVSGGADRGILICGTGAGMCIVANKTVGARAVQVQSVRGAELSREHNDANILCLGAWYNHFLEIKDIVMAWLAADFGAGRHVKRIRRVDADPCGKTVLATGCYDILHEGHLRLLQFAKCLGSYLVVGINNDESVRAIKGPCRPINNERDRRLLLESLRYVDEVIVFGEQSPTALLTSVRPNVYVKGGEWTEAQVRQRDNVPDAVRIVLFPLVEGRSTTGVIEQIRKGVDHDKRV